MAFDSIAARHSIHRLCESVEYARVTGRKCKFYVCTYLTLPLDSSRDGIEKLSSHSGIRAVVLGNRGRQ